MLSYGVEAYHFEGEMESQISKDMSNWQKNKNTIQKTIMQGGVEQMVDTSRNDMVLCMPTIHLKPFTKIISFEHDNMNGVPQNCVIDKQKAYIGWSVQLHYFLCVQWSQCSQC